METQTTVPVPSAQPSHSWLESIKAHVMGFFEKLPPYIVDILIFLPVGILIGFCSKAFGRYFLIALVIALAFFWLGDYFHIITFHKAQLQALFGGHIRSLADLWTVMMTWGREHIAGVVAGIIGFMVGWKLGA